MTDADVQPDHRIAHLLHETLAEFRSRGCSADEDERPEEAEELL